MLDDGRARTRNARPACELGADLAINYRTQDFVAEVKAATGGRGVDVILDMVGGDYIARNYEAAAVDGRIVQIAFLRGLDARGRFPPADAEAPDPYRLDAARRARVAEKAAIARALEEKVWPLLARGPLPAGDPRHAAAGARPRRPMR